jgi:hypothetical protein
VIVNADTTGYKFPSTLNTMKIYNGKTYLIDQYNSSRVEILEIEYDDNFATFNIAPFQNLKEFKLKCKSMDIFLKPMCEIFFHYYWIQIVKQTENSILLKVDAYSRSIYEEITSHVFQNSFPHVVNTLIFSYIMKQ